MAVSWVVAEVWSLKSELLDPESLILQVPRVGQTKSRSDFC